MEVADLLVLLMVAFVIALLVNIRSIGDQQVLNKRQAANVPVRILVLAAGVFIGIGPGTLAEARTLTPPTTRKGRNARTKGLHPPR
jgi:Mg2+/citrate symporter